VLTGSGTRLQLNFLGNFCLFLDLLLESLEPLFPVFLNRLIDTVVEVRVSVIRNLKKCLISNYSQPEALKLFF
jgi:hypothetical protein